MEREHSSSRRPRGGRLKVDSSTGMAAVLVPVGGEGNNRAVGGGEIIIVGKDRDKDRGTVAGVRAVSKRRVWWKIRLRRPGGRPERRGLLELGGFFYFFFLPSFF